MTYAVTRGWMEVVKACDAIAAHCELDKLEAKEFREIRVGYGKEADMEAIACAREIDGLLAEAKNEQELIEEIVEEDEDDG